MNAAYWQRAGWQKGESLLQLLRLDGSEKKIALVGAGGKTTLLFQLARELQQSGKRVLLTTTTHIWRPSGVFVTETADEPLGEVLREQGIAVLGRADGDKLGAPLQQSLAAAAGLADVVLTEADGSHGLPVKFPAAWEPVLAGDENIVLAVGGWSAVGRPLAACCHRAGLAADFLQKNKAELLSGKDFFAAAVCPVCRLQVGTGPLWHCAESAGQPAKLGAGGSLHRSAAARWSASAAAFGQGRADALGSCFACCRPEPPYGRNGQAFAGFRRPPAFCLWT